MRQLTGEERDKFNLLSDRYGDWSIAHSCIKHVEPFLSEDVKVVSVTDKLGRGKSELPRAKKIKWVFDTVPDRHKVIVTIFLSDGGVITITLEQAYFVKSAVSLASWESTMPKKEGKAWYVYVVRCNDGSLYCGTTTDVTRRVGEHNTSPKGAKYTRSRRPVTLIRSWRCGSRSEACKAELRFKSLSKAEKEERVRTKESDC